MIGTRGLVGFAGFSVEVDIGPSVVAILTPIGNDIYCMTAAVDQTALRSGRLARDRVKCRAATGTGHGGS